MCQKSKDESEFYKINDKKQIALAIRNSTLGDKMRCSLLAKGIIKSYEVCSFECICNWIDEVAEAYVEETTNVVSSFKFE